MMKQNSTNHTGHAVVAIDGPAASGKSTVARLVAARLGFDFVNSGALYRAMTFAMLRAGVEVGREDAVATAVPEAGMKTGVDGGASWVAVNGKRLGPELESDEVNAAVSMVARVPAVRAEVVRQLRAFAVAGPIVMEGRDIGSVVFPDTPWKYYVDASEEVRQRRRAAQGQVDSVRDRDRADSTRVSAPLVVPDCAVVIDSSELTPAAVTDSLVANMVARGYIPNRP
jgi:cytidylate kinase